ncbi:MAG: hypothetical protein ACRDRN_26265 [Sciscionella sp.]
MNAKKAVVLVVVALVLFFLITQPTQSAHAVTNVLGWLKQAAEAVILFVRSLFA